VALGRVPGALLVADQDVPQSRVEQRVVRGQDRAARDAEDDLRPSRLQTADEGLRSGHLLCHVGAFCRVRDAGKQKPLGREGMRGVARWRDERSAGALYYYEK